MPEHVDKDTLVALINAKAHQDEAFRAALLQDPQQAIAAGFASGKGRRQAKRITRGCAYEYIS